MIVKKGSTDVNVYFKIQAGLTATDFDTQYTRSGSAASTKADVTLLGGAGNAHVDNAGIYVDATTSPGLFRLCIPDAAVATGVDEVEVTLLYAAGLQETVRVTLVDNIAKDIYDIVNHVAYGNAMLVRSTTPANTLDISGNGNAGIDWNNIDAPTTAQNLSATNIATNQVVASVSGSVGSLATQAKADVNAEMVDVLTVDTIAELASVPSASTTFAKMLNFLYMCLRNKNTTSATQNKIHNDAGSVIGTASVSSTLSLYTKDEFA